MGVMDKFLQYMSINDEDNDDYIDNDYYDEDEEVEDIPVKKKPVKAAAPVVEEEEKPAKKASFTKVTPLRPTTSRRIAGNGMEVCVIRPTSVDEAREITETLLSNRTVVLNLEGIDWDVAQRIIDFTSGSCFAISGNLQRISNYIFIITPASVDISGDFQDLVTGVFNTPLNNDL